MQSSKAYGLRSYEDSFLPTQVDSYLKYLPIRGRAVLFRSPPVTETTAIKSTTNRTSIDTAPKNTEYTVKPRKIS